MMPIVDAVRWPEEEDHLSADAVAVVRALLEPLAERRLGAAGTHEAFAALRGAPFLRDVEWEALHSREGVAPFVPSLEGREDVSYFVSKPQPDSVPTTPMPLVNRQSSAEDGDAGDDEVEFLNFTFHGTRNLMQRNMELAYAEGRSSSPPDRSVRTRPAEAGEFGEPV